MTIPEIRIGKNPSEYNQGNYAYCSFGRHYVSVYEVSLNINKREVCVKHGSFIEKSFQTK